MTDGEKMMWAALYAAAWNSVDLNKRYNSTQIAKHAAEHASQAMQAFRIMRSADADRLSLVAKRDIDAMLDKDD